MPLFRIHRMKDLPRQQFRWAPHVSGAANVKSKDYELPGGAEPEVIEAENEYAAWASLRAAEKPLAVGDVLEIESGALRICKYVGFDDARWFVPEPHPAAQASAAPAEPQPAGA
jgi:hypothetical protein